MKAQIAQGGIFLILIITTMVVAYIIGGSEPVNRNVVTVEGSLMSFENYADLLTKTFDASIEFVSQRAAYDLGGMGGVEGKSIAAWDSTYPSIDLLRQQLENRIKENLPQGMSEDERMVSWGNASVNVSKYDTTCGPIRSSKCFEVDVNKSFFVYDRSIDSRISMDPYTTSKNVNSNYFRLLNAGRAIMEDHSFNTKLNDPEGLLAALNAAKGSDPRFKDLTFDIVPVLITPVDQAFRSMGDVNGDGKIDGKDQALIQLAWHATPASANWNPNADLNKDNYIDILDSNIATSNFGKFFPGANTFEMTMTEDCYDASQANPNTYCLAPLKPGEEGITDSNGNKIPYDYLKLKFRFITTPG